MCGYEIDGAGTEPGADSSCWCSSYMFATYGEDALNVHDSNDEHPAGATGCLYSWTPAPIAPARGCSIGLIIGAFLLVAAWGTLGLLVAKWWPF